MPGNTKGEAAMRTEAIEHQIEVYRGYAATYPEDSPERKDCSEAANQMESELKAIEAAMAAKDEAINDVLTCDGGKGADWDAIKYDAARERLRAALTPPTGKVLIGGRVAKLIKEGKPFIVVASHEPYYMAVYGVIRQQEKKQGTWTDGDESMYQQAVDVPKQSEQEHYVVLTREQYKRNLGLAKELELVDGSVLIDGRIVGEMFENIIPILRWCRRDALSDYLVKEFTPLRTDGSTTEKSIPSVSVLVDVEKLREMLSAIKKPIPQDIPRDQHINTLLCGIEDWLSSTLKDTQ